MELAPEELRVLGCLAEKQLTTPAQYPLTLNALTLACNQTSSRDPIVDYDEQAVEATVTRTKTMGLARFFHPSHGRSALRFGHTLDEALGLDVPRLALMTVLMLRGPQTLAELRTRTQRMADFPDTNAVEAELDALARFEPPLVARLGRRPGQKEERYTQLLGDNGSAAAPVSARAAYREPDSRAPDSRATWSDVDERSSADEVAGERAAGATASLVREVAELRALVDALRRDVDELRTELGV
jgi:uncharacterized protein